MSDEQVREAHAAFDRILRKQTNSRPVRRYELIGCDGSSAGWYLSARYAAEAGQDHLTRPRAGRRSNRQGLGYSGGEANE